MSYKTKNTVSPSSFLFALNDSLGSIGNFTAFNHGNCQAAVSRRGDSLPADLPLIGCHRCGYYFGIALKRKFSVFASLIGGAL